MDIRTQRQLEFAEVWCKSGMFGILNLCPRFGKIRTTLYALNRFSSQCRTLIAYPDNKIRKSWEDEFELMMYHNTNITFTTHLSLKKYVGETYNVVIIDEIHLLSPAQRMVTKELIKLNPKVLGLTGTLSKWTEQDLAKELGLIVLAEYPIAQGVKEGVITDYEITVFKVPLNPAEKSKFDRNTWMINKMEDEGKNTKFLRFARMRIIQNSVAKLNKTKTILNQHADERILVFCGLTNIADSLGISSYHSKSTEKGVFNDFVEGNTKHLAVVRIGNTGVTYLPLDKVIINYFSSSAEDLSQRVNRCMGLEYNNPEKKAQIYIISSNEPTEEKWLVHALEFFDKSKIKYL